MKKGLFLVLGVLGSSVAFSVSAADRFDVARAMIREHTETKGVPSIAVAVVKDGRIVWEEGFGWADKERRRAADQHTMYSLASLTKPFTSIGVMTLVQAGKVDLDRPVNDYLGDVQLTTRIGDPGEVTVRRVANHTAGLPGAMQTYYGEEMERMLPQQLEFQRYAQVMKPPGERFEYSNIGYGVLDYLIARVSRKSYVDYLRQEIFVPLGMTRSSVGIGPGLGEYQAIRYDALGEPIPFYEHSEPGSASMYSSAHDLARFALFLLKRRMPDQRAILSDASIDEMTRDPVMIRPGNGYALGWQVQSKGGYTVYGHGGSHSGANTFFNLIPEQGVGVVLLSNGNDESLTPIALAIFKALLPGWRENGVDLSVREKAPTTALQPESHLIGTWTGDVQTYEGGLPLRMEILPSGEIRLQLGSDLPTLLNQAAYRNGLLTGQTSMQIETSDTRRRPHTSDVALQWRNGILNGFVRANANDSQRNWWIYSLPYWVELRRGEAK